MTAVLDICADRFDSLFGGDRGLSASLTTQRNLGTLHGLESGLELLLDGFWSGESAVAYQALYDHRAHPEHPAVAQLLHAGAGDIAERVFDCWVSPDGHESVLDWGLRAIGADAYNSSPWLLSGVLPNWDTHRLLLHVADLRADGPVAPLNSGQRTVGSLCGRPADELPGAVKRGDWRKPSRRRARRCADCEQRAAGRLIPALSEPGATSLPSRQWRSDTQARLTAGARGALGKDEYGPVFSELSAQMRTQLVDRLGQAARADPLPAVCHNVAVGVRSPLGALPPAALHTRLAALDWTGLFEDTLARAPMNPAQLRATDAHFRDAVSAAVARLAGTV